MANTKTQPPGEQKQISAWVPLSVWRGLRRVADITQFTQSEIVLQALMRDRRIALEMDLHERAQAAQIDPAQLPDTSAGKAVKP